MKATLPVSIYGRFLPSPAGLSADYDNPAHSEPKSFLILISSRNLRNLLVYNLAVRSVLDRRDAAKASRGELH